VQTGYVANRIPVPIGQLLSENRTNRLRLKFEKLVGFWNFDAANSAGSENGTPDVTFRSQISLYILVAALVSGYRPTGLVTKKIAGGRVR